MLHWLQDDPASVLGVSPAAVRARLDAQAQGLVALRGEVAELKQKSREECWEFQAQVNAFASAARAAARQEGVVKTDKLALQQLRHEREVARLHAHYQGQIAALQQEQQQQQEWQQRAADVKTTSSSRRQPRQQARTTRVGPEATSAAAFFGGEEGVAAPRARKPPASAEEATYLRRRLKEAMVR